MNAAENQGVNTHRDIKYVVFDFDGTMVNSKEIFIKIFNHIAEKHHFDPMTPENIPLIRHMSILERFKFLKVPMLKLPFLTTLFLKMYKKSLDEVKIVEGIREIIHNLHLDGYKIAIISSNAKENVQRFLDNHEIRFISQIHGGSSIYGKEKMIRKFLKSCKLQSSEAIYVGDEQRDVEASQKNNIKVIWVDWGYDNVEAVRDFKPDYMVSRPAEILEILNVPLLRS